MNPEDASGIAPVRANFLPETGRDSGVSYGQTSLGYPFVSMKRRDRLLRRSYKIFLLCVSLLALLARLSRYFVKLLVELCQLRDLLHRVFSHKKWSVQRLVILVKELPQGVLYESVLEKNGRAGKKVTASTGYRSSSLAVHTIDHANEVHVRVFFSLLAIAERSFDLPKLENATSR